ncbi:hypothetical protein VPMS16_752 [Vibrio sp. 16]|nr:hypothetical protein VPMS16_752 [Vibrio sp. 16]
MPEVQLSTRNVVIVLFKSDDLIAFVEGQSRFEISDMN